jgi:hypothetical protein
VNSATQPEREEVAGKFLYSRDKLKRYWQEASSLTIALFSFMNFHFQHVGAQPGWEENRNANYLELQRD